METALFEALADCGETARKNAVATPWIASAWTALRCFAIRFANRYRLGRSIAHLNDRLLADVGLSPEGLGLGESLIRGSASEATLWAFGKRGRQP
jgi:uncharacterized protein YjiS (DUF1127 family)